MNFAFRHLLVSRSTQAMATPASIIYQQKKHFENWSVLCRTICILVLMIFGLAFQAVEQKWRQFDLIALAHSRKAHSYVDNRKVVQKCRFSLLVLTQ